jgi:quinolinate synthase
MRPDNIAALHSSHQQAEMLVHPECGCTTSFLYYQAAGDLPPNTHICSTEAMLRHARQSPAQEFIVATETGILHRMRKEAPEKTFYAAKEDAICKYMKLITLEKVLRSLEEEVHVVQVAEPIASRARLAIERMLQLA